MLVSRFILLASSNRVWSNLTTRLSLRLLSSASSSPSPSHSHSHSHSHPTTKPTNTNTTKTMKTRILKVPTGHPASADPGHPTTPGSLDTWEVSTDPSTEAALAPLREAAALLRASDVPVAFPTETVYGLGADATRAPAVRGIYAAKGRPSDNPLIVHVCDLDMLRALLRPDDSKSDKTNNNSNNDNNNREDDDDDPIPPIYRPLLKKFWPGPLTVLLPNPANSRLAPEVTAGLPTFGARMPASPLARTLIKLAGVPLAAPSANASTKPSPTAASHVLDDLEGRIEMILDGGACGVGVESTVVDGLCCGDGDEDGEGGGGGDGSGVPVVLRPGGVSMDELRGVEGWEGVVKGYKDASEVGSGKAGGMGPRAPGMKYKHYSPKARVVLFEAEAGADSGDILGELRAVEGKRDVMGVIRTHRWQRLPSEQQVGAQEATAAAAATGEATDLSYEIHTSVIEGSQVLDISLGPDTKTIAQGLFSALRELDRKGADVIFVEGVADKDDIAAAVMNRLRKAASEIRA